MTRSAYVQFRCAVVALMSAGLGSARGSFDGYLWRTVERKARFINQVMRGRLDVREIEDIGQDALSHAEVKALATGDPRVLEKAQVDAELSRMQRAHARNQRVLAATIAHAEHQLPHLAELAEGARAARDRASDLSGEKFAITIVPTGAAGSTGRAARRFRHRLRHAAHRTPAGHHHQVGEPHHRAGPNLQHDHQRVRRAACGGRADPCRLCGQLLEGKTHTASCCPNCGVNSRSCTEPQSSVGSSGPTAAAAKPPARPDVDNTPTRRTAGRRQFSPAQDTTP